MDDEPKKEDPFGLERLNDPEFEAVERAKLIPLTKEGESIPETTQQAFADFAQHYITDIDSWTKKKALSDLRIIPEKLFIKGRIPSGVCRWYYTEPLQGTFSDTDRHRMITIYTTRGVLHGARVYLRGEQSRDQVDDLLDINIVDAYRREDGSVGIKQLQVRQYSKGRMLHLNYKDGVLGWVRSDEGRRSFNIGDRDIEEAEDQGDTDDVDDMNEMDRQNTNYVEVPLGSLADKSFSSDYNGENYTASINDERTSVSIIRTNNGELQDKITVPLRIDDSDTLEHLFTKKLMEDPYNANVQDDEGWKNANIELFGAEWIKN